MAIVASWSYFSIAALTIRFQFSTQITRGGLACSLATIEFREINLGDIYSGAQSRFNNPVNLKRLISLIDETEWTALGVNVKAQAYEGLLEKAASEGKKGAGQYFTPRSLSSPSSRS